MKYIAFATDHEDFRLWCGLWRILIHDIPYAVVGQSKQFLLDAVQDTKYSIILSKGWNRKEYVDEEICNKLILGATDVYPIHSHKPYVDDDHNITGWHGKTVDRSLYMLPFVPKSQPQLNQFKWTPERDAILRENYSTRSASSLARELGCSMDNVYSRADQLHLKEKLGVINKADARGTHTRWGWVNESNRND